MRCGMDGDMPLGQTRRNNSLSWRGGTYAARRWLGATVPPERRPVGSIPTISLFENKRGVGVLSLVERKELQ